MREVEVVLGRHYTLVSSGLREALERAHTLTPPTPATGDALMDFYHQIEYHHGWRHPDLSPATHHPGKLLRPTLLLLACELAAGHAGATAPRRAEAVRRAVPAAIAVELVHSFSLVHDDIEDGDEARRHRPTLWKLWGVPQAINTGDGIFALARLQLWPLRERGVASTTVARLAELLDRTCLELCEGQFLDMRFEGRRDVTPAMYLAMIERKTAALMACAAGMGAWLGAPEDDVLSARLADFGRGLGLAFQLRDDLLGIWAARELGKTAAGDLRRKKVSLPVIYTLERAAPADRDTLAAIYAQPGAATEEQIAQMLDILDRAGARAHVRRVLRERCEAARAALESAAGTAAAAREPAKALGALLAFVAAEAE
ncbi:MAG: polyprenyl synthetase family protein [Ktedonobacterales bacterium]|nr:polyprenyl synthetase family protein [Ktedonobacterales bacterium]